MNYKRPIKGGIITESYVKAPCKVLYKSEYEYQRDLKIFLDNLKSGKNYYLFS